MAWRMLTTIAAAALAVSASAEDPLAHGAAALRDFARDCQSQGEVLWGRSLCAKVTVVDGKTRAAIANAPAPGFTESEESWFGMLPADITLANTIFTWQGTTWVMLLAPLPENAGERRTLIAHEAFHAIQAPLGFTTKEVANAHANHERARVLFRLEAAALARALTAKEDWRSAARDALSFNRARQIAFPVGAGDEAALLLNEGLAEYTGYMFGYGRAAAQVAATQMPARAASPSITRQLGYIFGPAYGLLLDRSGLEWKKLATKGAPLPLLLESALAPVAPDWKAAASHYGYATIAVEEEARAAASKTRMAQLEAKFLTGPVLRIDFIAMNIGFNPNTIESLGDHGTVYVGGSIIDEWGRFATETDFLVAPDWSHALVALPSTYRAGSALPFALDLAPGWAVIGIPGTRNFELKKLKN